MTTSIKQQLGADVNAALKRGDKQRVSALRLILAAVKQHEVDHRVTATDDQVVALLARQAKQRRESIEQFERGGRADLVARETFELEVINSYLPEPLTDDELQRIVRETIAAVGASSIKDMGKVVAALRPKIQGRADLGAVSNRIKALLG